MNILYVVDNQRGIQKRDPQGNWAVFDAQHGGLIAVDGTGNLYVAGGERFSYWIQKRDPQGNWTVVSAYGTDLGGVDVPTALATDTDGNFYVAEGWDIDWSPRIQKRDVQGNWSVIATVGLGLGQVNDPAGLAVGSPGTLYVADGSYQSSGIQKRDEQGTWSFIATDGAALGQVEGPTALAADTVGNVYVAENPYDPATGNYEGGRIQKRDAKGNWSMIASSGSDLGQVRNPIALAVDTAGNLYMADTGNNRVLQYTPGP